VLLGTHLDLEARARRDHADELEGLLSAFAGTELPTVVAGDMNDGPGSTVWQRLSSQRADAFAVAGTGDGLTFPARHPVRRIDGVFVSSAITVVSATVIDGADVLAGSDHRPVLVQLQFGAAGEKPDAS
jgi:endonuclease/exonuclease/phosphatase family metal-dependent hydrolase